MGIGDIGKLLGSMKNMQANMAKMQEELERRTVEASSGGGMVSAIVNGRGDLLRLKIDKAAVDVNDLEMLEDLIKAAVNAAVAKSQEEARQEMGKLTGGLSGLGDLGKMFGQ